MPIYEYVCRSCGRETERLQKLSDAPLTDCPECGRPELTRKLSAPSFRLKGSGWYETDFKSDKDKRRNLAGDAAPDSKPAETKVESKPEVKSADTKPAAAKPETKAESKPKAKAVTSSAGKVGSA